MNPTSPQRKRTRARGFDYREPGPYFVTICEHRRVNRFGHVVDQDMVSNEAGDMIVETWHTLPDKYPEINLDSCILMPNHFHGLITFGSEHVESNVSLSEAMKWFKTMTTNWYMQGVAASGWSRFDGHLWQRSFHDRIVRSDSEMDRFRIYIVNNAALWTKDTFFEP